MPRGTSYNGLYGKAPPERCTFFKLQVYDWIGISPVEVNLVPRVEVALEVNESRYGNLSFRSVKGPKRATILWLLKSR